MMEIDWQQIYREAKNITNVPWETMKPSAELESLLTEGKLIPCKALDIGCGFGTHAIFLAKKGFEVTALDISEKAIQVARKRAKEEKAKVSFLVRDAVTARLPGIFGVVFDRGLFHHLDPEKRKVYLKKIHGLLDPRGHYYLEVFSERNPSGPWPFRFSREDLNQYLSRLFKILTIKEIAHTRNTDHSTVYLYSLLMEKRE